MKNKGLMQLGMKTTNNESKEEIILVAVGDVCLGLEVRKTIAEHGVLFPFEHVREQILRSDMRFGNLEVVFPGNSIEVSSRKSQIWAEDNAINSLCEAQFDVMSFANNHIMDHGKAGFSRTLDLMSKHNIVSVGAGATLYDSRQAAIIKRNNLKVGFLAFSDNWGQISGNRNPGATEAVAKYMISDIRTLKKEADIVIVSLHMGIEFTPYPSPFQVKISREAVDAGANVIIGHHPHVLQGFEVYHGSLIFYSLGNFVFQVYGHGYQQPYLPHVAWGVILTINLRSDGYISHNVIPTVINEEHRPRLANEDEADRIMRHITEISEPLRDIHRLERIYRHTCGEFARTNYWWFRVGFGVGGIKKIIRMSIMMILRAPNRRWIAGFLRYMFSLQFVRERMNGER